MSFILHFSYEVNSVVLYVISTYTLQRCKASGFCSCAAEISNCELQHCVTGRLVLEPVGMVSYPRRIETSFTSIRHFSSSFSAATCLQNLILISISDYPNFTSIQASWDGLFVYKILSVCLFRFYYLHFLACNHRWSGTWKFWCSYGICCGICVWQICSTDTHFACPWLAFNNLLLHMQMHVKKHHV
jgi:hypothetical protein